MMPQADLAEFVARGVVYQADSFEVDQAGGNGQIDMVNDGRLPRLRHDIELFKELGLNAIYVCMSLCPEQPSYPDPMLTEET